MNKIRLSEMERVYIKIHKVNLRNPEIVMIWKKSIYVTSSANPTIFCFGTCYLLGGI